MEKLYICLTVAFSVVLCDDIKEVWVKRGETVTLPCDIVMTTGSHITWFRNCSHNLQPPLLISPNMLREQTRFSFQKQNNKESYDLQIKDVTAADLGTYYCANTEKKNDVERYIHGAYITRVLLTGNGSDECEGSHGSHRTQTDCSACPQLISPPPPPPPPPPSDCGQCWIVLCSVCAVCTLLFGILITICVSHICLKKDVLQIKDEIYSHGSQVHGLSKEHCCLSSLGGEPCFHTEVIYRPLRSSHTSLNQ